MPGATKTGLVSAAGSGWMEPLPETMPTPGTPTAGRPGAEATGPVHESRLNPSATRGRPQFWTRNSGPKPPKADCDVPFQSSTGERFWALLPLPRNTPFASTGV